MEPRLTFCWREPYRTVRDLIGEVNHCLPCNGLMRFASRLGFILGVLPLPGGLMVLKPGPPTLYIVRGPHIGGVPVFRRFECEHCPVRLCAWGRVESRPSPR